MCRVMLCMAPGRLLGLGLVLALPCFAANAAPTVDKADVVAVPDEGGAAGVDLSIRTLLTEWSAAWESGDLKSYFNAYDDSFQPAGGMSIGQWRAQRRERLRGQRRVAVKIDQLRLTESGASNASVVFVQRFSSPRYSDVTFKTLRLIKRGERWKIVSETITSPTPDGGVGAAAVAAGASPALKPVAGGASPAAAIPRSISSLRISSDRAGGGQVAIELSAPGAEVDVLPQADRLQIKLPATTLAPGVPAVQKSAKSDEMISGVRVESQSGVAVLSIDLRRPWVFETVQVKNTLLIKIAPKAEVSRAVNLPAGDKAAPALVTGTEEACYGGAAWQTKLPGKAPNPEAERVRSLKLKEGFRDCEDCPEMVVLPKGGFDIGSASTANPDESPVRHVEIPPFAAARYEVTWKEFERFALATNRQPVETCRAWNEGNTKWEAWTGVDWAQPGYLQSPTHPVVCVGWEDAKAYAAWLSGKTGKHYRLFSESEWEYAARGASSDATPWGRDGQQACKHSNLADSTTKGDYAWPVKMPCADGSWGVSRVGVYQANAYGLHDMVGNVWEWVEDCATRDYKQLATDGRPYTCGQCRSRIIRGASWASRPDAARFGKRGRALVDRRSVTIGFRVARDLE